jgi:hypothetical protein
MVRVECEPSEDKGLLLGDWLCSVDGGPRFETSIRIVTREGEHIIMPERGERFIADAEIVIINKEKGYIRIWMIK